MVTHSHDLSQAHEITLDIDRAKVFPELGILKQQAPTNGGFLWINAQGSEANNGTNFFTFPTGWLGVTPWIASASVTEQSPDGTAHVGAAYFDTLSVQLDQPGQFIRVIFNMEWQWPLPTLVMIIIGFM
jgi:hypothetical protein